MHSVKTFDRQFLTLKPESMKEPTTYLGATIKKHVLDGDSTPTWSIGSSEYLRESLRVVSRRIADKGLKLKTKVAATLPSGNKPELDKTDQLNDDDAILYMQLVGILRWLVELGRIDVCGEVSMMSAYNAMPRIGHFHAVLHIFAYLQTNFNKVLMMDPSYNTHLQQLPKEDFSQMYPFAKAEEPSNMPTPLGRPVELTMFVDASHAANLVTR